ncbi:MAG: protein-disulfide reductase DsbD domain-containing protein, partial [Thermoguttaceae bacterium]
MKAVLRLYVFVFFAMAVFVFTGKIHAQTNFAENKTSGSLLGLGSAPKDIVKINAQFTAPSATLPGRLFISAKIKPGWHIYSITQAPGGPIRTAIKLNSSPQYRLSGAFQAIESPKKEKEPDAFGDLVVETHEGAVTWHAPLAFSSGVDPATVKIEGAITVQPCDANSCLPPRQIPFSAALGQGMTVPKEQLNSEKSAGAANGSTSPRKSPPQRSVPDKLHGSSEKTLAWRPFTTASFKRLVGPGFDEALLKRNIQARLQTSNLGRELLLAFLGGIILNLMPCVLPVIGLKIISFVEQAGKSRMHAFLLNLWYSLGLFAVFMLLAVLAVFANLGWGQLFQYPAFNVTMAAVVFVMGLSF